MDSPTTPPTNPRRSTQFLSSPIQINPAANSSTNTGTETPVIGSLIGSVGTNLSLQPPNSNSTTTSNAELDMMKKNMRILKREIQKLREDQYRITQIAQTQQSMLMEQEDMIEKLKETVEKQQTEIQELQTKVLLERSMSEYLIQKSLTTKSKPIKEEASRLSQEIQNSSEAIIHCKPIFSIQDLILISQTERETLNRLLGVPNITTTDASEE